MAKAYFRLSKTKSGNDRQQIIVKLVVNRTYKPCFRSGVYIMPKWFKPAGACKSESDAVGEIKVPNKSKLNTIEWNEATEAKNALEAYKSRLIAICEKTEAIAPERLNKDNGKEWIEDAERIIRKCNIKTEEITYNKIVELLEQEKKEEAQEAEEQALSFFEVWDKYIAQHQGTQRRIDHVKVMKRALQRFELFSGNVLDVNTFSCDQLRDFKDFLRDEHTFFKVDPASSKKKVCNERYRHVYEAMPDTRIPEPRSKNYLIGRFKLVRAFFTWAVRNDYTTNDPFRKFVISREIAKEIYGTPFYLTTAERNQLYRHDFGDDKSIAIQRDIFVFQCLVGCRVGDLYRFTRSNIISKNGVLHLSYIPRKTKEESEDNLAEVPLSKIALEILSRYEAHTGKGLFPFIAEQNYNEAIKKMLRLAGIDRIVTILNPLTREDEQHPIYEVATSHMARRTFVGNMYQKAQDPNVIGSMSGHVSGSKAFSRYRKIEDEIKINLINAIEE